MPSRVPPRFRHLRHNPPLSEHMAHDDLNRIAYDLYARLQNNPSEGLEFVIRCLGPIAAAAAQSGERAVSNELRDAKRLLRSAHSRMSGSLPPELDYDDYYGDNTYYGQQTHYGEDDE